MFIRPCLPSFENTLVCYCPHKMWHHELDRILHMLYDYFKVVVLLVSLIDTSCFDELSLTRTEENMTPIIIVICSESHVFRKPK